MSRSYKKHPVYTSKRSTVGLSKKWANKKVRRAKMLSSGNYYRRLYEQWAIRDYRDWLTENGANARYNKIYSIHTVLDYDSSTDQASRPANYVNHLDIMRGIKTLFVQDLELNVIGKYEMRFRRPFLTSSFNVHFGNLYSLAGTNPKGLLDADGRQNLTFSYVDVRYMEL